MLMDTIKGSRKFEDPRSKAAAKEMSSFLDDQDLKRIIESRPKYVGETRPKKEVFSKKRKAAIAGMLAVTSLVVGKALVDSPEPNKDSRNISFIAEEGDTLWDYANKFY